MNESSDDLEKLLTEHVIELQKVITCNEETENLLHGVLHSSLSGIMVFRTVRDDKGGISDFEWLLANPSAEHLLGRTEDDLLGKHLTEEFPGNLDEGLFNCYAQVAETGQPARFELRYRHETIDRWYALSAVRLNDGLVVTFDDITEAKRAEIIRIAQRDLGLALTSVCGIDQTLNLCLETALQVSEMDGGGIYLFDETTGGLLLRASKGISPEFIEKMRYFPPDSPQVSLVLEGIFRHIRTDDPGNTLRAVYEPEGIRTVAMNPLLHNHRVIGCINLASRTQGIMPSYVRDAFEAITGVIGNAITRSQAEENLVRAKDAADAANRAKSLFLASMSHEIRTPMNAIIGMTDLILQERDDPKLHEDLQTVSDAAHHLLTILNDILDLSKIEAGKISLEIIDFDIDELLHSIVQTLSVQTKRKGLTLTLHRDEQIPRYVRGDPNRLRQIFVNLIGNAVKFTDFGGITVEALMSSRIVDADDRKVRMQFRVSDTGIGIPKDKQEIIFENFRQTDTSIARKYGGTGLGLSICRQLTELMEGAIWVESEPGKGASFFFETVFEKSESFCTEDAEVFEDIKSEGSRNIRPLTILLAEDNPINAGIADRFLSRMGHSVLPAQNGKEVLAMLRNITVDLIFMDVEMPVLDGIETTCLIRSGGAGKANRQIPIIAMTAHVLSEFRKKCEDAGMNDFVMKPVDFRKLSFVVDRIMRKTSDIKTLPCESGSVPEPELDASVLNYKDAIERFDGDANFYEKMFSLFAERSGEIISILRDGISGYDMEEVARHAHSLKGMCANIGAEFSAKLAKQLETTAKSGDHKGSLRLIEKIEKEIAKVKESRAIYNL